MPYYKWSFRGLGGLPLLSTLAGDLEYLISSGNTSGDVSQKAEMIESVCSAIAEELRSQSLSDLQNAEMEQQAYALNDTVADHNIRNLHILHGV